VHAQNPDIPALSAVIIRNGETLDSATMGLLDLDESSPFSVDTPAGIAALVIVPTHINANVTGC
jgi:hypothetical protein